jgi:GntR family transcriptional regulator
MVALRASRGLCSSESVYVDHVREIDPLGRDEPTYIQVADVIAGRIETGEFTHKLPAERALAEEFGVAYQTVRHSMKVLRERGLIITRQGRGTFVAPAARRDRGEHGGRDED